MPLNAEQIERETLWWCIKRQVKVVGGWHIAAFCPLLIWDSAREVQAEVKDMHRRQLAMEALWDRLL